MSPLYIVVRIELTRLRGLRLHRLFIAIRITYVRIELTRLRGLRPKESDYYSSFFIVVRIELTRLRGLRLLILFSL